MGAILAIMEAARAHKEHVKEDRKNSGHHLDPKPPPPPPSKRQCSEMDDDDMQNSGRHLNDGKCTYAKDTLRNSGHHLEDKEFPHEKRQQQGNDNGMPPFQLLARLARYFSKSTLGPFIQGPSRKEIQPLSSAPASLAHAVHSAGETPQPLISSPLAKTFDSALDLKDLIFNGNPEPTYVAVAPAAIASPSSAEGLESFLRARGGFALASPLFFVFFLWLVISVKRANKQRRVARIEHELVGPYSSSMVERKGDLESGSV